jgi:hypothetical protein
LRISSCHQLSHGSSRLMSQLGEEARFKAVLGGWGQSVDGQKKALTRTITLKMPFPPFYRCSARDLPLSLTPFPTPFPPFPGKTGKDPRKGVGERGKSQSTTAEKGGKGSTYSPWGISRIL